MTSGLEGVRGLVEEIAHQKPEKPDYWNSCSQCERNIDAAQEALAALPTLPAAARGDVRAVLQEMRDRQVARRFKSQTLIDWADRIEAALAAEGVQAGEVEQRARELLAAEWEVEGYPEPAKMLRAGWTLADEDAVAIRAIIAALSQQPEARGVVDEAMVERAYQAWRKAAVAREGNKPAIRAALTAALTGECNAGDGDVGNILRAVDWAIPTLNDVARRITHVCPNVAVEIEQIATALVTGITEARNG